MSGCVDCGDQNDLGVPGMCKTLKRFEFSGGVRAGLWNSDYDPPKPRYVSMGLNPSR